MPHNLPVNSCKAYDATYLI